MIVDVETDRIPTSPRLNGSDPITDTKEITEFSQLKDDKVESPIDSDVKIIEDITRVKKLENSVKHSNKLSPKTAGEMFISKPVEIPIDLLVKPHIKQSLEQQTEKVTEQQTENKTEKSQTIMLSEFLKEPVRKLIEEGVEKPIKKLTKQDIEQETTQKTEQETEQRFEKSPEQLTDKSSRSPDEKLHSQPLQSNRSSILNNDSHLHLQSGGHTETDKIPKLINTIQLRDENKTDSDTKTIKSKRNSWQLQEDLLLKYLKEVKNLKWDEISTFFIDRSPITCSNRYYSFRKINERTRYVFSQGSYFPDITTLKNCCVENKLPEIIKFLKDDGCQVIKNRPNTDKNGIWQPQADLLLRYLKESKCLEWSQISEYFLGRTPESCRGRWQILSNSTGENRHAITPDYYFPDFEGLKDFCTENKLPELIELLKNDEYQDIRCNSDTAIGAEWNLQSDLLLTCLRQVIGLKWDVISEYFLNRTATNCRVRWNKIQNANQNIKNDMLLGRYYNDVISILKSVCVKEKIPELIRLLLDTKHLVDNSPTKIMKCIPWDLQSDLLLRYLKEVRDFDWDEISEYFINRTAPACFNRWKRLKVGDSGKYHAVPMTVYSIDVAAILKNMGVKKKLPDLSESLKNNDITSKGKSSYTEPSTTRLKCAVSSTRKAEITEDSDQSFELDSDSSVDEFFSMEEQVKSESPDGKLMSSNLVKRRGRKAGSCNKKKVYRKRGTTIKKRAPNDHENNSPKKRKISKQQEEKEEVYGILEKPNIKQVQFGLDKLFPTWYGCAVYFEKGKRTLGIYSFKDRHSTSLEESRIMRSPSKHNDAVSVSDGEHDEDYIEENGEVEGSDTDSDSNIRRREDDTIWLDTLFVCEYCFKYTTDAEKLRVHDSMCRYKLNRPPGKIKYRSPEYTIRRVKGYKEKLFCQCLCLFTKLFLDNKSIYFKVENYDFFILYKTGERKPMAFFSKDITSFNQNNLACILTLPPYQKRRLGSLLIEFSYKLSRSEGLISGPELPLSPFGLIGYINHWGKTICYHILDGDLSHLTSMTVKDISLVTGFRIEDIIMTLNYLECLDEETGTININQIFIWLKSRNKKNEDFMLKDEYLMISD